MKAFIIKDGINILAPEIVLLYKSTNCDNSDYQHDYEMVINELEAERYEWLMTALKTAYPRVINGLNKHST